MTNKTTTPAGLEWPADVLAFAIEHQLDQYLPVVLEVTRQVFPSARRIDIRMEEDAEDADDWRILYEVHVPLPWPQVIDYQYRWYRERAHCCPSPYAVFFRLRIEVVA